MCLLFLFFSIRRHLWTCHLGRWGFSCLSPVCFSPQSHHVQPYFPSADPSDILTILVRSVYSVGTDVYSNQAKIIVPRLLSFLAQYFVLLLMNICFYFALFFMNLFLVFARHSPRYVCLFSDHLHTCNHIGIPSTYSKPGEVILWPAGKTSSWPLP